MEQESIITSDGKGQTKRQEVMVMVLYHTLVLLDFMAVLYHTHFI